MIGQEARDNSVYFSTGMCEPSFGWNLSKFLIFFWVRDYMVYFLGSTI